MEGGDIMNTALEEQNQHQPQQQQNESNLLNVKNMDNRRALPSELDGLMKAKNDTNPKKSPLRHHRVYDGS
jgi:hypothetical protein